MKTTTLYCELLTAEQVAEFDTLMDEMGYDTLDRPAKWAERPPYWARENKPRGENDDPLAAVILTLCSENRPFYITSAYRCVEGKIIDPEIMKCFIACVGYTQVGSRKK